MKQTIMLSVQGKNHKELVKKLSNITHQLGGVWLNSKISHIANYAMGLIKVEIDIENKDKLVAAIEAEKFTVSCEVIEAEANITFNKLSLCVDAKHRTGLVQDITAVLSDNEVTVNNMECHRISAGLGGTVFNSTFSLLVPQQFDKEALITDLKNIPGELFVDIKESN
jgi:glycine cleavage system regulatory protein